MKLRKLLSARIENGWIIYHNPIEYSKVLSALNGKDVVVSICPQQKSVVTNKTDTITAWY